MLTAALLLAVAFLAPSALSFGTFSSPRMDCNAIANALPGRVYTPGSTQYETSDRSYFAAFENELSPACIVQPQSSADVSTVIKTIASHAPGYLAIRSGGHTPWAGAANINNGVTLDLQALTGVRVNPNTGIASIASGERWSSVYQQLGSQGLAIAGGRVSKVGVGGLITGGLSHPRLLILGVLLSLASGLSEQTLTIPCDAKLLTRRQQVVCPISLPPLDLSATMWSTTKSSLHLERLCKPMPTPTVTYSLR